MPKPEWLQERDRIRNVKRCMTCAAGGDPCGTTTYLAGRGRLTMYRCRKHPTIKFWHDTLACEDYERRR